MQHLEVSGAERHIYASLGFKGLRETSRTREGVLTSYDTGISFKLLAANGNNVLKILTFGPIRE